MKTVIYDVLVKQPQLEMVGDYIYGLWEYASDMHEFVLDDEGNDMGKFRVVVEWISNDEETK